MPTPRAPAPASFEIKSANLPLLGLLLKTDQLDTLQEELAGQYGATPDFFDQDPLLIDLAPLVAERPEASVDFPRLLALLRQHKMAPLAVCGGSAAMHEAARSAGLSVAAGARVHHTPRPAAAKPAEAPPASAMLIERPVRAGVQIYARGRDLIVNAMVNPGAEIIANGHIHVYAPLRGRVIAGARGDSSARIFALNLEPELIAIAGVYQTAKVALPANVQGRPAQIYLDSSEAGHKLVAVPML